ncbi:MAG: RNA pseudouridine synthase [Desulfobacteraceae bacterium]|nr:RNA pseudouridine synthase [Desulfobacteraceae bacterium]
MKTEVAHIEGVVGGFRILHMADGWAAVDKPAGMSVHNDPGRDLCSRFTAFLLQHPEEARQAGWDSECAVHPVHRIDRDTSGAVLLALGKKRVRGLSERLSATGTKRYLAVVHGHLEAAPDAIRVWTWPLSKKAAGRTRPQGPAPRAACTTECRVMEHSPHYTLVEARPLTGRRHQIRRHAKLAGHPVVGDRRYGSRRALSFLQRIGFRRMALHAATLTFTPPGEKEPVTVGDNTVPGDFRALLEGDASDDALGVHAAPLLP